MALKLFRSKKSLETQTLRQANALLAHGEYFQAISILERANIQAPSCAIETRLIEIRHDALYNLKMTSELECWPPETVDLFPSTPGIPEVQKKDLTVEKLRSSIFHHGSLIVRNLLGENESASLIANIDEAFRNYDAALNGEPLVNTAPWFVPFTSSHIDDPQWSSWNPDAQGQRFWVRGGGGIFAADSPRTFNNLLNILRAGNVLSKIGDFLGETPALSVLKTTLRRVPHTLNASPGWHQDGAFLGKGIRTINLWIALSDCGIDAPTLDMVPVRLPEIAPTGTEGAAFDWSVAQPVVERYSVPLPPVRLQFKAGDAILFDEMNLHRTAISPEMTKSRYAIEAWFFAPSCYPMDQLPLMV